MSTEVSFPAFSSSAPRDGAVAMDLLAGSVGAHERERHLEGNEIKLLRQSGNSGMGCTAAFDLFLLVEKGQMDF